MTTTTTRYRIEGMTCEHCVGAVTSALREVDGVAGVEVDLAGGIATVASVQPIDERRLADAVDDAGYQLLVPPEPT